jgi:hypothetical protein
MKIFCSLFLTAIISVANGQPKFPLKISENRRHFVDQNGRPFLYHADTGWQLFVRLTKPEALEYLLKRKSQGFNTIQVQIAMEPKLSNRYGHKPFNGDVDFSKPNEAFHDHAASVIAMADSLGLLVVMTQPWLGCCFDGFGNSPEQPIQKNGPIKNRSYGQYLGKKFAKFKNLFWIAGGDNDPRGDRESLLAFIEGLYSAAPRHQLITYHATPPHSSTDLFQYAPWLGFSFIYTYWREKPNDWVVSDLQPHVYEAALREWSKSDIMPFVLGESQYEGSGLDKNNDMGTPQIIRRQAYWTMLCGGAGVAYGADVWHFPTPWRERLDYVGANQLKYFITFFESIPWWTLVPDVKHQAVVSGYGEWSKNNFVTTAVSDDKKLMVSYLPQPQPVSVDLQYLNGNQFEYYWLNPTNGEKSKPFTLSKKEVVRLGPINGEDWVLIIKTIENNR